MADRRDRLDQPQQARRGPTVRYDPEAFGRLTERVARFLGTGRYLVLQSIMIIIWIIVNVIPGITHFDPYTFTFLTLILSLQAAYAAPLILLAQNRQDDRDRVNLDQDRDQARTAQADVEYLARELAAVRLALGEVVTRDFLRSELTRADTRDGKEREPRRSQKKPKSAAPRTAVAAGAKPARLDQPVDPLPAPGPDSDQS